MIDALDHRASVKDLCLRSSVRTAMIDGTWSSALGPQKEKGPLTWPPLFLIRVLATTAAALAESFAPVPYWGRESAREAAERRDVPAPAPARRAAHPERARVAESELAARDGKRVPPRRLRPADGVALRCARPARGPAEPI